MHFSVKINGFEKKSSFLEKGEAITYAKSLIPVKKACTYYYKIECSVVEKVAKKDKKIEVVPIMRHGYGTISGKSIWSHVSKIRK